MSVPVFSYVNINTIETVQLFFANPNLNSSAVYPARNILFFSSNCRYVHKKDKAGRISSLKLHAYHVCFSLLGCDLNLNGVSKIFRITAGIRFLGIICEWRKRKGTFPSGNKDGICSVGIPFAKTQIAEIKNRQGWTETEYVLVKSITAFWAGKIIHIHVWNGLMAEGIVCAAGNTCTWNITQHVYHVKCK